MLNNQQIVNYIKEQAEQDSDIEVVWLYGSVANGTDKESSDVDIAIAFKSFDLDDYDRCTRPEGYSLTWQANLNLPDKKISVVDINTIPIYLAYNVIDKGKVLVGDNTLRVHTEFQRITSMFEHEMMEAKLDAKRLK